MKNIKNISNKLSSIGKKVYIVGGWCRENFLNSDYSGDIDLATDALPNEVSNLLKVVNEVGKKYGTMIINEGGEFFELTTFRKDIGILNNRKPVSVQFTIDLVEDSKRRDFTFNSIYFDIEKNEFIDPQNGIEDLKNKIIRFVGDIEDRIKEDALRILRFVRFKNKYNFNVGDINYFFILKKNIGLLKNISNERIKSEFDKILTLENNINALNDLKEIGFFQVMFPEIDRLSETPGGQKYHLEGNVWIHTLMTISELNILFLNGFDLFDKNLGEIKKYFTNTEKIDLYWTLLLHDTGKFDTYSKDENGFVHYYNHEVISVDIAKNILNNYNFSKSSKNKIIYLIENHLKVFKIFSMKKLKSRKFMLNKYFEQQLLIGICDHLGRIPTDNELVLFTKNFYKDFLLIMRNKKFFTAKDIIEIYPNLLGFEIKNKLEAKNNEILLED